MSPALSFQEEWLDPLLRDDKRQTTRPQTTRIKVGDVCTLYNQQRRRIMDKPLRRMTYRGIEMMEERGYPLIPEFYQAQYHAHLLGKVEITNIYVLYPHDESRMNHVWTWEDWARKDGFKDSANLGFTEMELADTWFRAHYHDDDWMDHNWTVIQWDGWLERYFDPEATA